MWNTASSGGSGWSSAEPLWRIAFLFHSDLDLFGTTLPRCVEALTGATSEPFEVVVLADGTPEHVAAQLPEFAKAWGVDEVQIRSRARFVASGDASNNGHRRLFAHRAPYLIIIEDDVVMYRTERQFDPLAAIRAVFERHRDVPVLSTVSDYHQWSWKLRDLGSVIEPGVRSVNRLSTHFIAYAMARFLPVAERFGAFEPDVFIDREDHSYNWEDIVTHVGTTGGRRIAFPESWPLNVFHCDRKVGAGSMYHTQRPEVKAEILAELEERYRVSA